jgi:hypothetical protein
MKIMFVHIGKPTRRPVTNFSHVLCLLFFAGTSDAAESVGLVRATTFAGVAKNSPKSIWGMFFLRRVEESRHY